MKKQIALFASIFLLYALNSFSLAQDRKIDLFASVGGISSVGDISKDVVLNSGIIDCSDPEFKILSFVMSVQLKNDEMITFKSNGNSFSEQMKSEIKAMEPGYKLVIEEIYVKPGNGKARKINSIVLTIL
jgi:hypothetical protein